MSCSTNNSSDIVGSEKYVFDQFMLYINLEYESDEIYKKHFDKLFKHHFDKIIIDSNFIENFNTFIYNCKYVSRKKNMNRFYKIINLIFTKPILFEDWKKFNFVVHMYIDYEKVSKYPYFEPRWVFEYPRMGWDYKNISSHPSMCLNWIQAFQHFPIDFHVISKHENFDISWVIKCGKVPLWDWDSISGHKNFQLKWIDDYPHLRKYWNWDIISSDKELTSEFIKKYECEKWNWGKLSSNHNFTFDWIDEFSKDKNWNMDILSAHPKLTLNFILTRKMKWNGTILLSNPAVSAEYKKYLESMLGLT